MKKFTLLTLLVALFSVAAVAQTKGLKVARSLRPAKAQVLPKTIGAQPFAQLSNRASAESDIIWEAPAGEVKTYTRSGDAYVVSNSSVSQATQSGTMEIVFCENKEVYMKDQVYGMGTGAYSKGTLSEDGKTITMPLGQPVYWSSSYSAAITQL